MSERVVFDCNVFFQAIISPTGPAGRLFGLAAVQKVELFVSQYVVAELRELTAEPKVCNKYRLTAEVLDEFFEKLTTSAVFVETVPSVFEFPRDPDDAHYVDLAVAAGAKLIVSRDKDLLSLADASTPEGRDFQTRFPDLQVLTPPQLLAVLEQP